VNKHLFSLYNFLKKNNFNKESSLLKKIATPIGYDEVSHPRMFDKDDSGKTKDEELRQDTSFVPGEIKMSLEEDGSSEDLLNFYDVMGLEIDSLLESLSARHSDIIKTKTDHAGTKMLFLSPKNHQKFLIKMASFLFKEYGGSEELEGAKKALSKLQEFVKRSNENKETFFIQPNNLSVTNEYSIHDVLGHALLDSNPEIVDAFKSYIYDVIKIINPEYDIAREDIIKIKNNEKGIFDGLNHALFDSVMSDDIKVKDTFDNIIYNLIGLGSRGKDIESSPMRAVSTDLYYDLPLMLTSNLSLDEEYISKAFGDKSEDIKKRFESLLFDIDLSKKSFEENYDERMKELFDGYNYGIIFSM
jgi:hypothetical protein